MTAPVVAAVAFAALNTKLTDGSLGTTIAIALLFYPAVLLATVLLAGPMFFLLLRRGFVTWWTALAAGSITGFLVSVALSLPNVSWDVGVLISSGVGAASALTFWLIWRLGHYEK